METEDDPLARADDLIASGRAAEAASLLDALHARGRGGILLQTMRVRALAAAGQCDAALGIARESARLYPNVAVVALALGEALAAASHPPAAIAEFQRALRLDPALDAARFALGRAWLAAGESEPAAQAFAQVPETMPGVAECQAEIAAMRGRTRADPRYVRHLFDQFSTDYDTRMLGQLAYGAPQILRALAEMTGVALLGPLAILDLGCGTGLAGAAFRDLAARLDGIDLSPAMIAQARARAIYDELRVGDIESELSPHDRRYDMILAADTLVYLGDLAPVLCAVRDVLVPGGAFLFTVERCEGEGFELGPKRRWRHSEACLRAGAAAHGFDVEGFLECSPRSEAGKPVEGYAVALAAQ